MYIKYCYSIVEKDLDTKEYKDRLKALTPLNLRRASKYNALAVLGALECVIQKEYEKKMLGIYVASEFSCALEVASAVEKVNTQEVMPLMPFDFLNVNSNNVGFYIAKALNAGGKNCVLTSQDLGFEKALALADFDLSIGVVQGALIGGVDVCIDSLQNHQAYLPQNVLQTHDCSCWIYASTSDKDAVAKIESICEFANSNEVLRYVESLKGYDLCFNTYAANDKALQRLQSYRFKDRRYAGIESAHKVIEAFENEKSVFISKAKNGSFISFLIKKMPLSQTN
jgi:hypothetical protein